MATAHIHDTHPGLWNPLFAGALVISLSLGVLGIIGVSLYRYTSIDLSFLRGEIVAYSVLCEHKVVASNCSRPELILVGPTYKPDATRQEVLYWHDGGIGPVEKLTKCAVRDRQNWSCKFDDESAKFGFTYGQYWSKTNEAMDTPSGLARDAKTYYVSRWEGRAMECRDDSYERCMWLYAVLDTLHDTSLARPVMWLVVWLYAALEYPT